MDKLNKALRNPQAELEAAIAKGCSLHRIDMAEYAETIRLSPSTLQRRRKSPNTLTIKEASRIAKMADIEFAEFAKLIGG